MRMMMMMMMMMMIFFHYKKFLVCVSDFSHVKILSRTYALTHIAFPVPIQTGHEAHAASSIKSTGILPVAKLAGGWHLAPMLRMSRAIRQLHLYSFIKCYGAIFTFNNIDTRNSLNGVNSVQR
jgi:hypothetical protein